MKKILPFVFATLLLFSCKNDDDNVVDSCVEVTNVVSTNVTFNSVDLTWTDSNAASSFSIEYGPSGFAPGSGTTISSDAPQISITNLNANTTYDIYVQARCTPVNSSLTSAVYSFTTQPPLVVAQFTQNLSEMNLFSGNLAEMVPSIYAFEYEPGSTLFVDYAHKQRLIAIPQGTTMAYIDDGFPDFPDGTVIAKTFYYYLDEANPSQGKHIIETRVLIKQNGEWDSGDYRWNADMTEATLDPAGGVVPITYQDENGTTQNVNYMIPSDTDCFSCHSNSGEMTPIGPKLRSLNFDGQLQNFINEGYVSGLSDASSVGHLPVYTDLSYSLEERARAYFDMNCAHCHTDGGYCENQSTLRLSWETSYEDSQIFQRRFSIMSRMQNYSQGFSMPLLGTTMNHSEGYELIQQYLNSLE